MKHYQLKQHQGGIVGLLLNQLVQHFCPDGNDSTTINPTYIADPLTFPSTVLSTTIVVFDEMSSNYETDCNFIWYRYS